MKEDEYKADILASQAGDTEALNRLWVAAVPLCYRVATDYVKHYEWIDHDDLAMNLVERVPHFVASFKVDHASTTDLWKYLFFRLRFYAKDVLRKEDPLGISHPQKQMYPQWSRLGDEALDNFDPYAADINWEALDAILDGEVPNEAIRATLQQIAPERFNKKGSVWAKKAKRLRKIRKLKRPRPTKKRSLKFFLDQKKEIKKMFGQPISPSEITPPEIPMIPQFPDEPSPRPPAKRKRKPGPKPGSKPANAKPKQPANATPAATDLLTLACRFVDAAGGLANARNLLRQIGDIRK